MHVDCMFASNDGKRSKQLLVIFLNGFVGNQCAAKCKKRLLQRLGHGAWRFSQYQGLIGVEERTSIAMEEVKKVPNEPHAIKYNDFGALCPFVERLCVEPNVVSNRIGGNENVIVDLELALRDFRHGTIDIVESDCFLLHFVSRDNIFLVRQTDLDIAHGAGLFVGSVVTF